MSVLGTVASIVVALVGGLLLMGLVLVLMDDSKLRKRDRRLREHYRDYFEGFEEEGR